MGAMRLQLLLLASISLLVIFLAGCIGKSSEAPIQIGLQLTPASALIQIADEKEFFAQNGLKVEIEEFSSGRLAFQALLGKSVELATPADLPVALAKLQGNKGFYIITGIGENRNEAPILVRDDKNSSPKEYFSAQRRKISTALGGTPEFILYLFLKNYQIPQEQVEVISQKPEEMAGAFSAGSVDGIAIFEPYPSLAEKIVTFKTNKYSLPSDLYLTKYLLVADSDWTDKNPEKVQLLIKSLRQAERFAKENPTAAKQIVTKKTKFSADLIDKIWPDFNFNVQISQEILGNFQLQTKWAIETGKVSAVENVDFSDLFRKN